MYVLSLVPSANSRPCAQRSSPNFSSLRISRKAPRKQSSQLTFLRVSSRSKTRRQHEATPTAGLNGTKDLDAGTAAEALRRLGPAASSKVISTLPTYKSVEIIQGAIRFRRWDKPTKFAADMLNEVTTPEATDIIRSLEPSPAISIVCAMNTDKAVQVLNSLDSAGELIALMAPEDSYRLVPKLEKGEAVFKNDDDLKFYRGNVEIFRQQEADIEGVESYLSYAEQVTFGKLKLLNERGKWEPWKKEGWRGWLFIVIVVGIPTWAILTSLADITAASKDVAKLLGSK